MGNVMSYTTIIQDKLSLTTKKILYAIVDQANIRHKHNDLFSKIYELTYGMTTRLSSSCVAGDVKYFDSVDDAMSFSSTGYDIVIVQSIGNFINRNRFFSELDNYIVNNPDFFIIAFTLDWQSEKGTDWIECHNQIMVVNVASWRLLGKPKFGGWETVTEELPNYSRSVENFHDNYTPYWIKGEPGTTLHTRTAQGWNFIKTALAAGYKIDNFTEEMRACRLFIYPEHEPDNLYKAFTSKDGSSLTNSNQKKWIKSLLNAPPGIWIFNSEYYRFSVDMKKVDTYFGPAAGFKYLDFLNYNPDGKFIFYDYNAESINWIKKLKETWDGEDFYKYLQQQPDEVKQYYKFIHGNKFNKENIEKNLEILFKEFGGKEQFKKLWNLFRQSEATFVRVDLFNSEEIKNLLNLSSSEYVFFNFSNIFATDFTLLNHTIAEVDIIYYNFLLQVENKFNKFILYGSDPTGTWQTLNRVPKQVLNTSTTSGDNTSNNAVTSIKEFSKMTKNLIAKNLITPLTVIDVGCSGGLFEKFRKFEPLLKGLGADPIIDECSRLHSLETNPNIRYVPTFVGTTINKDKDLRFGGYNWERTAVGNFSNIRTKR
jgi:hypothetical protein